MVATKKDEIKLKNLLLILISFGFVILLIYFTNGVTIYWHLFVVPIIMAAFTYNTVGGLVASFVSAGTVVWWMYTQSIHPATVEIPLGLALDLGIGVAIGYLAKKQKEQKALLEGLSTHDRLTGLNNYSYFIERLNEEAKRSDRYGTHFSLIMFDIDFFKMLNDTFGHEAGNEVLKKIGQAMKKEVRSIDIVSRYGGEEFAILLPHLLDREALKVAERVRKMVERMEFHLKTKDGPITRRVTISGGVAAYPSDADNETDLVINADHALYKAKGMGRNKICLYAETTREHSEMVVKH